MKISILNGGYKDNNHFHQYIQSFEKQLKTEHDLRLWNLHEMDIRSCTGCWNCWWKSPGLCATKDDAPKIFSSVIQSDILILASPIIAGFTSYLLKMITDRLIVLLHPYIKMIDGESHHNKRYPKYPLLGVILEKEIDTDTEDLNNIRDLYQRLCINFHSELLFFETIDEVKSVELANKIVEPLKSDAQ